MDKLRKKLPYLGLSAMMHIPSALAQTARTMNGASQIQMQWGVPEEAASSGTGNLYFQMRAPDSYSWVGLGISSSGMIGADIFIIYEDEDGNVTLSTRDGVGEFMPEYVERSDVELLAGSGVIDGELVANIRCGDCSDRLDLAGENEWIAAWRSGDALMSSDPETRIEIHDEEAEFTVDFAQAAISADTNPFLNSNGTSARPGNETTTDEESSNGSPNYDMILKAHGIIMTIVFTALYPLGALLMPLLGKWYLHMSTQMLAFLLMWAGFALGYVYAEYDGYLWKTHPLLGTIVVSLLGLQPILGWLHHAHIKKHGRRSIVSHIHIWYGRSLMILGIINGGLGLQMSGQDKGGYLIAYCVVVAIFAAAYIGALAKKLLWARGSSKASEPALELSSSAHDSINHGGK